jgi:Methyltransferase domain
MSEKQLSVETQYEKNQSFNAIMAWFHSLRYKNILEVFSHLDFTSARPIKVVDIGCAHAKLFSVLDPKFQIDYVGIETDGGFVDVARERCFRKPNVSIIHASAITALEKIAHPDIIVALETLEHIPERDVVRLIEKIATVKPSLFVCSVPIEIGPAIWMKNVGSLLIGYMRHQEYTWLETFWAGLGQLDKLPPHGTGHKGFDWRWLAQTIRHNMKIREIRKLPLRFLPAAVSTSVFIVAEPRK